MIEKSPRIPRVLFLNPWEKLIGPNQYLVKMLQHAPEVAQKATVVLHEPGEAFEEYRQISYKALVWEDISQIRARLCIKNLASVVNRHSFGLRRIIRNVIDSQPDLIVSNTEQLLLGDLVAKVLGIPHLKIFHAITFTYRFQGQRLPIKAYLKAFTFGSDRIIAVSDTLKRALISGGLKKAHVTTVPNPIPTEALQNDSLKPLPNSLQEQLRNRGPVLVNAGRISPLKGQDQLVEALRTVKRRYPDILCIFAGQLGSDSGIEDTRGFLNSMQRYIQDQGLTDNVLFTGEIDYLPSLMRCADLYVHTSRMESFCRAVAEALSCGTPVVAFDSGAIPEVAGPGAILVSAGDTEALAAAIVDLLTHREKRELLAVKGREHIQKYYDAEKVSSKFTNVLRQQMRTAGSHEVKKCAV